MAVVEGLYTSTHIYTCTQEQNIIPYIKQLLTHNGLLAKFCVKTCQKPLPSGTLLNTVHFVDRGWMCLLMSLAALQLRKSLSWLSGKGRTPGR